MFHKKIYELRKGVNKTQQWVADRAGISRVSYSRYETGDREPDFTTLSKLADLYNCTTDYLLGRTESPELEIKKAPPESGADFTIERKDNIIDWTPEKIEALKKFVEELK